MFETSSSTALFSLSRLMYCTGAVPYRRLNYLRKYTSLMSAISASILTESPQSV